MKLSEHWSFNLMNDPKRLGFVLARYDFVRNISPDNANILELGCSEGIGLFNCSKPDFKMYLGVDMDDNAIAHAKKNFESDNIKFLQDDFLGHVYGAFNVVLSLDVVEHISPDSEQLYFNTIRDNLMDNGVGVVGTPSLESQTYASAASLAGHVNVFDYQRLKEAMEKIFHNVFVFGMNDEQVHVGFPPMRQYLIAIGVNKR